ncbi:hypothetical protein LC087_18800 (plasmid) [Bacillus carboniphilus]|uniref:Uncharacterized protein n=1 Tax=Bacillus carboniphilus TaxID=86663 RepID=A0ABY9K1F7_9BACI|nr:hypothetical protein [Bacillus carboniphilus]WLR44433.1 hypothetical protein LC087_18800 [Bacillus carboniphilus]
MITVKNITRIFFPILTIAIAFGILVSPSNASAEKLIVDKPNNGATTNMIGHQIGYKKSNVKTTYSWSSYKRVSDNLKTSSKGGSLTANKSVSFSTQLSGAWRFLNLSLGGSVSSSKGYTLNVGPNKRVYMGYRVRYKTETGYRITYDKMTGRQYSKKKYTFKKPLHGEYALRNYK